MCLLVKTSCHYQQLIVVLIKKQKPDNCIKIVIPFNFKITQISRQTLNKKEIK